MGNPVTLVTATGTEITAASPLAVTAPSPLQVTDTGTQYPVGATPLVASSGNVANAVAAASLVGGATTTVHITGFEITGAGATGALVVTVNLSGVLGGPHAYTYVFEAGAAVANKPLIVAFDPPLPASAVNTQITVTCPAGGAGNTNNTVVAHGYHI